MNGQELLRIVDSLQRDKGVDKETIMQGVEFALASAIKRHYSIDKDAPMTVTIDRVTGDVTAEHEGQVFDTVVLGRIAAQTAKQVIIQKLREAEREVVFTDYGSRIGELVNGSVQRVEPSIIIVNLGRTEGILPKSEQAAGEFYRPGERIRCIIKDVVNEGNRVKIVLSRRSGDFVRRLFELEVPEIMEKVIEIKGLEREAGFRCKVAVSSIDARVDAVGACVGVRGSRIRTIVDELNGERIDIIRWSDKPEQMIVNSLKPAEIARTELNPEEHRALIVVDDSQLSLAIGRRGQNVRLASRLTKWDIDVVSFSQLEDRAARDLKALEGIPGSSPEFVAKLRAAGILSLDSLKRRGLSALAELGCSEDEAEKIMDYAYEYVAPRPEAVQHEIEPEAAQAAGGSAGESA
ncbi:MAG: transcription termination factor NusA [Planctomycetota bacterium]